jgi:hypothetical protein
MPDANVWNPLTLAQFDHAGAVQVFTATPGQTTFRLTTFAYAIGTVSLKVFKDGILLDPSSEWAESNPTTFVLTTPAVGGEVIVAYGETVTTVVEVEGLPPNMNWVETTEGFSTTSYPTAIAGHMIFTLYKTSAAKLKGSGVTLRYTGYTDLSKASEAPSTDGYFYDLDGKRFEYVGIIPDIVQFGAIPTRSWNATDAAKRAEADANAAANVAAIRATVSCLSQRKRVASTAGAEALKNAAGEWTAQPGIYALDDTVPCGFTYFKGTPLAFPQTGRHVTFMPVSAPSATQYYKMNGTTDKAANGYLLLFGIDPAVDDITAISTISTNGQVFGMQNVELSGYASLAITIDGVYFNGPSASFIDIIGDYNKVLISKDGGTYTDKVTIKNVKLRNRANTGSYAISLYGLGDGVILEALTLNSGDEAAPNKGVVVGTVRSARVFGLINGDHLFDGAKALDISGCHQEVGTITLVDTNAVVHNNYFCNEADRADRPLVIGDGAIGSNRFNVTIAENEFTSVLNRRGGWSATDLPDVVIRDKGTRIVLENNFRTTTVAGSLKKQSVTGILVGSNSTTVLSEWRLFSHLYSNNRVVFDDGTAIRPRLNARVVADLSTAFSGFQSASLSSYDDVTYQGATALTYYGIRLFLDIDRQIGRNAVGTAEVSLSPTNGDTNLPTFLIQHNTMPQGQFLLRLYRGPSTGSYDSFIDLPAFAVEQLIDDGNAVNGFAWRSRGAAGFDPYNDQNQLYDVEYRNDIVNCRANAAWGSIGGMVGQWTKGDTITPEVSTPLVSTTEYIDKVLRLTDGNFHVERTDWVRLSSYVT